MTGREQQSLRRRWRDYQALPHLRNHWYWRPGWSPARRGYTWHLTFDDGHADLRRLVSELQSRLRTPALDPVPLPGLHLTMQGVGFTDEVSPRDLAAIVGVARRRCAGLAPFPLTLGPVDPDAEGVGLLVTPWRPVEELRKELRAAVAEVWGHAPEAEDGFRPHVTIAYSGADAPVADLVPTLAELRSVPPVEIEVSHAQLIALRREGREYRWDVVATVPLGDR